VAPAVILLFALAIPAGRRLLTRPAFWIAGGLLGALLAPSTISLVRMVTGQIPDGGSHVAMQIEALSMQEVTHAQVGHIVASLKESGRQHALVAEPGGRRVRGIFSATQIARQLGVQLQTAEVAKTFAEIEAALLH
jgi:hypothetical protein